MQQERPPYQIQPLGDQALQIGFGNRMDPEINAQVLALYQSLLQDPLHGITEMVPAFSSLAVFFDPVKMIPLPDQQTVFASLRQALEERLDQPLKAGTRPGKQLRIPVCYDPALALDLEKTALSLDLDIEEIIRLHSTKVYRVYMNGFLPGFPYLGELDNRLFMSRKPQPERVPAGSVGIAGRQTGIYPLEAPGGWHIIGRTPLKIFETGREETVLLQAGDTVQFYPVSLTRFDNWYSANP